MSPLVLLTTLRYSPSRAESFPLLDYHVVRLLDAWNHFALLAGRKPEQGLDGTIRRHVQLVCEDLRKNGDWRIRVLLHFPSAEIQVESYPMPQGSPEFELTLEPFAAADAHTGKPITLDPQSSRLRDLTVADVGERLGDPVSDPADLYRYKTTCRSAYDAAAKRGKTVSSDPEIFDTLLHWSLLSEPVEVTNHDLITEFTTSNIAVHSPSPTHPAQWITPRLYPDRAPFLRGVMRTYLLSRNELREEDISVEEFRRLVGKGRRVVGLNGLRGIWLANPILEPQRDENTAE